MSQILYESIITALVKMEVPKLKIEEEDLYKVRTLFNDKSIMPLLIIAVEKKGQNIKMVRDEELETHAEEMVYRLTKDEEELIVGFHIHETPFFKIN